MIKAAIISLLLVPQVGSACSEYRSDLAKVFGGLRSSGEACKVNVAGGFSKEPIRVSEVTDLGNGLVIQSFLEDRSCASGPEVVAVSDCPAGKAIGIKGYSFGYNLVADADGHAISSASGEVVRLAALEGDASLQEIGDRALRFKHGVMEPLVVEALEIGRRVEVLGRKFDTTCGCRHFYPESAGARGS